jgi:hypothetical protein
MMQGDELARIPTILHVSIFRKKLTCQTRDPALFPDFEEFGPGRFLDESGEGEIDILGNHGQGHSEC